MDFKSILVKYIGAKIRDERLKSGLNQETLASKVGLTRASISNIESGRQQPTIDILYHIGNILGIEIHFLLPTYFEISSQVENNDRTIDKLKTKSLSEGSIKAVQGILDKYKQ